MKTEISRRTLLRIFASLIVLEASGPAGKLIGRNFPASSDSLASSLAGLFSHKRSAEVVGREYLRRAPAEADVRRLVHLIFPFPEEQHAKLAKAGPERLRSLILSQQRRDFELNRIVKVQGWMLSQAEARLCALATLI